jgi:hypothetical protein
MSLFFTITVDTKFPAKPSPFNLLKTEVGIGTGQAHSLNPTAFSLNIYMSLHARLYAAREP